MNCPLAASFPPMTKSPLKVIPHSNLSGSGIHVPRLLSEEDGRFEVPKELLLVLPRVGLGGKLLLVVVVAKNV